MMPIKRNIRKHAQSITVFRGINRSKNTAMSRVSGRSSSMYMEFKNTKNVTLDDYPAIRTRDKRLYIGRKNSAYNNNIISNILACDTGIIRLERDGRLYFGESRSVLIQHFDDDKIRMLVEFGNKVLIFPDKLIVTPPAPDNNENGKVEYIENCIEKNMDSDEPNIIKTVRNTSIVPSGKYIRQDFAIQLTDNDNQKPGDISSNYRQFYSECAVGDICEDTHTNPSSLYMVTEIKSGDQYSEYFDGRMVIFTQIYNTFTKIVCEGIGKGFASDDYVNISGTGDERLDSSFKILEADKDYIVINCETDRSHIYEGAIKVERKLPGELDFVTVCNNRLWGCSSKNNRIYASRLSDIKNWEAYGDGIASDSYFTDVSTEGAFTGAISGNSGIYFFKENAIHKIMGNKPRNFQLVTYDDLGIKSGCSDSVQWVRDRLFYHSPAGVCVYTPGGEPTVISQNAFGNKRYRNSVAGKYDGKYVICLESDEGYERFTYDTDCSQWIREDTERFTSAVCYRDNMYFADIHTGYIGSAKDSDDNLIRESVEKYTEEVSDEENHTGELIYENENWRIGDVDGDRFVTKKDVLLIQKFLAGGEGTGLVEKLEGATGNEVIKFMAANASQSVNSDEIQEIDVKDATAIEKWLLEPEVLTEEELCYELESGDIYDYYPEKKYILRLDIGCEIASGELRVYIQRDGGVWEEKRVYRADKKRNMTIPLHPGRCDRFRIKLAGRGEFVLYSITITTEEGSKNSGRL